MATLGDPLADVSMLLAYRLLAGIDGFDAISDAMSAPGFLRADEMLERYARGSGRDVSAMGFHLALTYFKLAVILEGIHSRYLRGHTVGADFERIGVLVEPLVSAGLAVVGDA